MVNAVAKPTYSSCELKGDKVPIGETIAKIFLRRQSSDSSL